MFTERQLGVGDTRYLLAQVTPFDFNWRCDVYGNILAVLFNVLDVARARIAFRFMWGGDQRPVAGQEPVPGGPFRRPGLAALLHRQPAEPPAPLPQRRHLAVHRSPVGAVHPAAGIPPHRLPGTGQTGLLNQDGIFDEWEFNEWAHGETGRPMGKAYQAWSASGIPARVPRPAAGLIAGIGQLLGLSGDPCPAPRSPRANRGSP